MLRNRAAVIFIVAAFAILATAGCGSDQSKTAKPAAGPPLAIIDMDKAVKAHPRYGDMLNRQKEAAGLAARLEAENAQGITPSGQVPGINGDGLEQAANQEFTARMAAREAAAKTGLEAEAAKVRQALATEMDAYAREVDKEYQPRLFNIQLKMKTVQLTKEEAAALQAEAETLQKERAAKLAVRQQELAGKMDSIMRGKQADAERELTDYARSLNNELAGKLAGKQAEAAGRLAGVQAENAAGQEKLMAITREIADLQQAILRDIRDKAAKIAAEKKIDTVLAEVRININAVDITDAVIAEFKKQ